MNRGTGVFFAVLLAAMASTAWAGGSTGAVAQIQAGGDQNMTSTSEQDLRRQLTIAGQPQTVLWAAERLGPDNPGSFPPGPSDHVLRAVLTYGSAAEVAGLVGEGPTEATTIETPAWFPDELRPGKTLDVVRHHDVPGFMDAVVMTVPGAPGVIVLERRSS